MDNGDGAGGSLAKPIGRVGNGGAAAFRGGINEPVLSGVLFAPPRAVLKKAPEGGVPDINGDGLLPSLPLEGE